MNKYLLFISLALFASCSGWSRGNSIQVSPGITNTLNFACGSDNGSSASFQNGYSYGFYGIPLWLRSSGASLSGVPSGSGPWQFTVSFNGPNNAKGSMKVILTTGQSQASGNSGAANIVFAPGTISRGVFNSANWGNFVILFPYKGRSSGGSSRSVFYGRPNSQTSQINQGRFQSIVVGNQGRSAGFGQGSRRGSGRGSRGGYDQFSGSVQLLAACSAIQNDYQVNVQALAGLEADIQNIQSQWKSAYENLNTTQSRKASAQGQIRNLNAEGIQYQINAAHIQLNSIIKELQNVEGDASAKAKAVDDASKAVKSAQLNYQKAEANAEANRQAKINIDNIQYKYDQARSDKSSAEATLNEISGRIQNLGSVDALNANVNAAQSRYDELRRQLADAQAQLSQAKNALVTYQNNVQGLQQSLSNAQATVNQARQKEQSLAIELNQAANSFNGAASAGTVQEAKGALDSAINALNQAQSTLDTLRKNKGVLDLQRTTILNQIQTLNSQKNQGTVKASSLNSFITLMNNEYQTSSNLVKNLQNQYNVYKQKVTQQRAIVEQKKRDLNACTKNNVIHFTDGCGELFLQSVNTVEGDGQLNVNSRGYQVRDWNGQSYQPGPCTSANAKKMKGQTNVRFSAYKIKGKQYLKSVKAK